MSPRRRLPGRDSRGRFTKSHGFDVGRLLTGVLSRDPRVRGRRLKLHEALTQRLTHGLMPPPKGFRGVWASV